MIKVLLSRKYIVRSYVYYLKREKRREKVGKHLFLEREISFLILDALF